VRYLVPHALIVLAMAASFGGHLGETPYLILFFGGHLLVPIWAAAVAPRGARRRAILLGPVLVIGVHALVIVILWIPLLGGFPEDTWLTVMLLMMWSLAVVVYAVYCAIAFAITARARR
jgi:hypothetical protein